MTAARSCFSGRGRGIRRPARRRADRGAARAPIRDVRFAGVGGSAYGGARACRACFRSAISRSSASPPSRRACRRSCGASARRPTPSSPPIPTCWSSSTARNSPIASRARCARARRISASSTMSARRSGRGGRGARAPCAAYVDHVLALLPFEPAAMQRLGGPPLHFVGHPLAERVHDAAAECRGGARAASAIRRCCWCCRAAAAARSAAWRRSSARRWRMSRHASARSTSWCRRCRIWPSAVRAAVARWPVPVADRHRYGREARGVPAGAGGAGQIRHRRRSNLRWPACRWSRPTRCRLPEEVVGRPLINVAELHPGQSGARRECRAANSSRRSAPPEALGGALLPLLSDTPERRRQVEAFARLDRIMEIGGTAPSDRAAALVLQSSGGI